jgi:glycosyltransferase involved in cell wall biosynthesis
MQRAVIVSQNLPPLKNISTVRITEVANQFAKNGYEVIGISSFNYQIEGTDNYFLHPAINIYRVKSWDFLVVRHALKGFFKGKKVKQSAAAGSVKVPSSALGKTKSKIASFIVNYLPFSLVFGTGNIFYILHSFFKVVRECEKDTIVFSSFRPFSDHLIAYLLKLFRPGIFWICDFRDPYIPPNSKSIFFKFHNWFNTRICRRANVVTAVSHGVARNLAGYNKKIEVLRNGIVGNVKTTSPTQASEKFRIVYTGGLYEGLRNPSILLEVLNGLLKEEKIRKEDIQLVYAGSDKMIWDGFIQQFQLENVNCSYGMLPIEQSRQLQESAAINLLLTWADHNYKGVLTGKMYEYFRAGKPVIAIVNGDRDEEIEDIMEITKAGPVSYSNGHNKELLMHFILEMYRYFASVQPIPTINKEGLECFKWDVYFPQFLKEQGLPQSETEPAYAV